MNDHLLNFDKFVLEKLDTKHMFKNLMNKIYVSVPATNISLSINAILYFTPGKKKFYMIESENDQPTEIIENEIGNRTFNEFIFHIDNKYPNWKIKVVRRHKNQ